MGTPYTPTETSPFTTRHLSSSRGKEAEAMTTMSVTEQQEIFELFDKVGDNKIALSQIGQVIRALGQNPTEEACLKMMEAIGGEKPDPKKRIPFNDFAPLISTPVKTPGSEADYLEGFHAFDRDSNGLVSVAELRNVLGTLGERLTDVELDQLLQGVEVNYDGKVDYS